MDKHYQKRKQQLLKIDIQRKKQLLKINRQLITALQKEVDYEDNRSPIQKSYEKLIKKKKQIIAKKKKMLNLPENKYGFVKKIKTGKQYRCTALDSKLKWCEKDAIYFHQELETDVFSCLPVCKTHMDHILKNEDKKSYSRGFYFDSDLYKDTSDGKKITKKLRKVQKNEK